MKGWWIVLMLWVAADAQAVVSLSATRMIFNGQHREASIEAINEGEHELLVQAWLSEVGSDGETSATLPFVLTPHLIRLFPNGRQALRVIYQGIGMPDGRESLLHLYVMQIPRATEGENPLSIAVRQRINLFYRPPGLSGDPASTPQALRWNIGYSSSGERQLRVSNPTVFYASLLALEIATHDGRHEVRDDVMLAPGETLALPLKATIHTPRKLHFKALTDYGGQRNFSAPVSVNGPFNAVLAPQEISHE